MSGRSSDAESRATGILRPVWRDILLDTETAVSAFARLRRGPFAFLLESAPAGSETWARYTFLGAEPRGAWRLQDSVIEDWDAERGWHGARKPSDPFADLRGKIAAWEPEDVPELGAFWGGAVGYFGYDVVRYIERLPNAPPRGVGAPDALFVFTGAMVIIDNLRGQARVVSVMTLPHGAPDADVRRAEVAAQREIDDVVTRLRTGPALPALDLDAGAQPASGTSTYERSRFLADVRRIKEYIVAGDVFQALLARRIVLEHDFDGASLYRAIRALNPSPYMYHLELDGLELVGSSPELQVRVADDTVIVRPIAGTRARGRDAQEDALAAATLLADEKERAEHVMLVDLGRNDVGRVAEYGSVRVTELMKIEKYSHVMHIVSEVTGRLAPGRSTLDVLRATFPAGTMSGAPKVRAMEIIDELEPERRGPYSGAVGYIAYGDRRMDLAITIRTCVIANGEASVQVGAGIVADSVPEREWVETEEKARAMLTA
ncbi:MAG: anthranilate synthase component I family protein, partial [Gemmatimonadales bacterium]